MTFAGGPYNNFMVQGLSQLAKQVRESQTTGVITSVSGMLTKQGLISLSTEQPPSGMYLSDVSDKTQSRTERMQIEPEMCGNAKVVSSTVSYSAGAPQVYVLVENHDKQRRLLISDSNTVIEEFLKSHKIGDTIHISQEGFINL